MLSSVRHFEYFRLFPSGSQTKFHNSRPSSSYYAHPHVVSFYVITVALIFDEVNVVRAAAIAQSVQRLDKGWTNLSSNSGAGGVFRTLLDRSRGPPSFLQSRYRVSFSWVKRPGRGVNLPPPSGAEVKERVEPHFYPRSGPSWPVQGWTFYELWGSSRDILCAILSNSFDSVPLSVQIASFHSHTQ